MGAISTLTAEVLAKRGMKLFAANLDSSSVSYVPLICCFLRVWQCSILQLLTKQVPEKGERMNPHTEAVHISQNAQFRKLLALFPGPAQFSVTSSMVLQATESWAGPENENRKLLHLPDPSPLPPPSHQYSSLPSSLPSPPPSSPSSLRLLPPSLPTSSLSPILL